MRKIILISILTIMIGGCATKYHRVGFTGGYSETQLGENVFQVSFRGNAYISRQRTSDFCLLRSAEISLENDYKYFIIVDSEKYSKTSTYTTGKATATTYQGQTYFISKPRATNTIICFKEKPNISGLVYDAEFISKSIRKKYGIKH